MNPGPGRTSCREAVIKQPISEAALARFHLKVDKRGPDDCWPFTSPRDGKGYGRLYFGGEAQKGHYVRAHRVAWIIEHGPISDGMDVCHRCDNPPCCNPRHLFLGTHADNNADKMAKERQYRPPEPTHCRRGHPLVYGNVLREWATKPGRRDRRRCRTCFNDQQRARYQTKVARLRSATPPPRGPGPRS